jgi:cation:H+ antiporter
MPNLPFSEPPRPRQAIAAGLLLLSAAPIQLTSPWSALWTTPAILIASLLLAWGAETAQFFVAQGFALAILAWLQTLPEFAVEAVLAWKQQTTLLLANLTGALRLLTGLAWPIIYFTAAVVHRRRTGKPMREIQLRAHHSVEVVGLIFPLLYAVFIWWKGTLEIYDAVVLIAIYAGYLVLLSKLPPEEHERVEDLAAVPRAMVRASRPKRNAAILACFFAGGAIIYFVAEPFLGSLVSLATALGIPSFVIIQWLAPVISEFPELLSTFYFARQEEEAPVALMNIVSSNINQWTLLVAMLPIVLSMGHGSVISLTFDAEQEVELLLTVLQSTLALLFLMNMRFAWWEATLMFALFASQFVLPEVFGAQAKLWISTAFAAWGLLELLRLLLARRSPRAFKAFSGVWRAHVR